MASVNVFVYGTLMADQIAGKLLGRIPASTGATLSDHIRYRVKSAAFPAIVAKPGENVNGKVRELPGFDHSCSASHLAVMPAT